MKGSIILIDTLKDRASQAALIIDGRLEDLLIDTPAGDTTPAPGAIYWARVDRLVPKMGGAFVKLTPEHMGFLRDAKGVREGAGVLVQVATYAEPGKAVPVTGRLLYKGRLAIHTPSAPGINVSRQIRDTAERDRLEACARQIVAAQAGSTDETDRPVWEDPGIILRSLAEGAPAEALGAEIAELLAARLRTERRATGPAPLAGPVMPGTSARGLALREWQGQIEDAPGLFDRAGVWDEIEKLRPPRAELPSGGWMAIEATRAMVTVDVNTAGEFGGSASLTANLEAARELPRQLRLRGLGGQVTIDFAPLAKAERRRIEEALKAAFRRDPVETTLAGWTPLGNFELQRKRERRPLSELLG